MPTTGEAPVFTPRRYAALNRNDIQPPISTAKQIPLQELRDEPSQAVNDISVEVQSLREVPSRRSNCSRLAKVMIAAICAVMVVTSVAIPLGVVFSSRTTTLTTTATSTTTSTVTTETTATSVTTITIIATAQTTTATVTTATTATAATTSTMTTATTSTTPTVIATTTVTTVTPTTVTTATTVTTTTSTATTATSITTTATSVTNISMTTASTTTTSTTTAATTTTTTTSTVTTETTATTITTTTATTSTTKTTVTTSTVTTATTATTITTTTTTTTKTTSTTTTSSITTTTTTALLARDAFWPFDNNVLDLYNNFNGNTFGNPSYVTSYLGTGAALRLTRTSSQYAAVTGSQLLFNSSSFTIELWIYPISLSTSDYGIFGQCQATTTNLCMFFIIRYLKLCCGFGNNDLSGVTTLTMNTWSHVACVYNLATQTQEVWLNGVLDASRSSTPYVGSSGHTTIGVDYLTPPGVDFFNGYLDQMKFFLRAKTSTEILNDATLVVYYSFDGGSLLDNGSNGINATASGNITSVSGRVNQALRFQGNGYIRPSYAAFFKLGVSNQAFSMALWVQPTGRLTQATLVFVNMPGGWCVGVLSIQSNGSVTASFWSGNMVIQTGPVLPLNIWTHIGCTYSTTNGLRLYVNGSLVSTTGGFSSVAVGAPVYVTLGSNYGFNTCTPLHGGWFNGLLDEYYLYSREITAAEMFALFNP